MKATGIVRSIDELGRIVIPKEIRRTMRIESGTPIEIYTDETGIFLKKYVPSVERDELTELRAENETLRSKINSGCHQFTPREDEEHGDHND